jgi:hypothetical protein
MGQSYEVELRAEGSRLDVLVDGKQKLSWNDTKSPYLYGQIGFANFPGCHTRYEAVHVS